LQRVGSFSFCVADHPSSLLAAIAGGGGTSWIEHLWEAAVHEQTTRKSVTFLHPFSLGGIDEKLDAGTYIIETLEELIEGLSFVAFRRVSTTIVTTDQGYGQATRQVVTIDPHDLERAQQLDAETEISAGPLAHLVAR
jgi:hypothetical protein